MNLPAFLFGVSLASPISRNLHQTSIKISMLVFQVPVTDFLNAGQYNAIKQIYLWDVFLAFSIFVIYYKSVIDEKLLFIMYGWKVPLELIVIRSIKVFQSKWGV